MITLSHFRPISETDSVDIDSNKNHEKVCRYRSPVQSQLEQNRKSILFLNIWNIRNWWQQWSVPLRIFVQKLNSGELFEYMTHYSEQVRLYQHLHSQYFCLMKRLKAQGRPWWSEKKFSSRAPIVIKIQKNNIKTCSNTA